LERNPAVCHALKETTDWEVASHGYRWIDYRNVNEETEREHIERTIKVHEKLLGKRPVGLYQGKVRLTGQKFEIGFVGRLIRVFVLFVPLFASRH
jgi:peptidoglycan/xylan/chitin deacetylase (PgdA/CDA1 family)